MVCCKDYTGVVSVQLLLPSQIHHLQANHRFGIADGSVFDVCYGFFKRPF